MESKISLGQVIYSKSGRDTGKAFIVVAQEGEFLRYADGDLRRLEKAKKKNRKHIVETGFVDRAIMEKLQKGERVSNAELRKCLNQYRCENAEEG